MVRGRSFLDSRSVGGEATTVLHMLLRLVDAGGQAKTSVHVSVSSFL